MVRAGPTPLTIPPGAHLMPFMQRSIATIAVCALAVVLQAGEERQPLKAFYFGNSYCENSVPWFHPSMFASAGKEMKVATGFGPGWQVWMHLDEMRKNPQGRRKMLVEGDWNTMVIHLFGEHPGIKDNVRINVFDNPKTAFDKPRDASDLASSLELIDIFKGSRKDPSDIRVFIYTSWPGIPGAGEFKKRVAEETEKSLEQQGVSREDVLKQVKERKPILAELKPLMESFDYAAVWLAKHERIRKNSWSENAHSRDYYDEFMKELKAKTPELWSQGRLAMIPCGEVFFALNEKMKAGKVPGITNIGYFSRDGGHVRAGLPRYTLAATCYAVMFREHPGKLDYSIYNDLANYVTEKVNTLPGVVGSAYVHQPDLGEVLVITPELAKIVNDTIWEVVTTHPHTNLQP